MRGFPDICVPCGRSGVKMYFRDWVAAMAYAAKHGYDIRKIGIET